MTRILAFLSLVLSVPALAIQSPESAQPVCVGEEIQLKAKWVFQAETHRVNLGLIDAESEEVVFELANAQFDYNQVPSALEGLNFQPMNRYIGIRDASESPVVQAKLSEDGQFDLSLITDEGEYGSILKCKFDQKSVFQDFVSDSPLEFFSMNDESLSKIKEKLKVEKIDAVAFDIDDTLLFSAPAFRNYEYNDLGIPVGRTNLKNERGEEIPFGTDEFWAKVNSRDREHSPVKKEALKAVKYHLSKGHKVYAITARRIGSNPNPDLYAFICDAFKICDEGNVKAVYFEPKGKTERLVSLGVDVYYGDSDSDITDALKANAFPVRVLRSPGANYKNVTDKVNLSHYDLPGMFRKYHPGEYGEWILSNSAF